MTGQREEPPQHGLTILSVAMARHVPFVRLNVELTGILNRRAAYRWLIVDNEEGAVRATLADLDVELVDGVPPDEILPGRGAGSYHHATALNRALSKVETRYVLVLDPDFFIIRPSWVTDVLEHMGDAGPALLGVPWHPRWHNKARGRHPAHCVFLDLARVDRSVVDFAPDLRGPRPVPLIPGQDRDSTLGGWAINALLYLLRRFPKGNRIVRMAVHLTLNRGLIGVTRDTGHRLREVVDEAGLPHEFIPACAPRRDFTDPPFLRSLCGWWLERLIPTRWSYVPSSREFVATTLAQLGGPNARAQGWEEFAWRGDPFGFHVRGTIRDLGGRDMEREVRWLRARLPVW